MYEEQVAVYGRSELATKAIEEYRLAIEADHPRNTLRRHWPKLYAKTGRIRDAVLEAQDILKRDPNNLEATSCWDESICARWRYAIRQWLGQRAQAGYRAVRTDYQDRTRQR